MDDLKPMTAEDWLEFIPDENHRSTNEREVLLALKQRELLAEWIDRITEEGHMFGLPQSNLALQYTAGGWQIFHYQRCVAAVGYKPLKPRAYYCTILEALRVAERIIAEEKSRGMC